MESNLVKEWLRRDPIRWLSGIIGGFLAGGLAMGVGMLIASTYGYEATFPAKLMATPILGPSATDISSNPKAVWTGFLLFEAICVFFGVIYSHFVIATSLIPLLAMGLVWGLFSWIFIWNLYLQSFSSIFAAQIPSGPVMPVCLAYGLALASIGAVDHFLKRISGANRA